MIGGSYESDVGRADCLPSLSVVLPTLNEHDAIETVVAGILHQTLPVLRVEVIVVDDGSHDDTVPKVLALASCDDRVHAKLRRRPDGLAGAIAAGVESATSGLVAWMDADGSMPPHTLAAMVEAYMAGADVVVGSRYTPGGAPKGVAEVSGTPGRPVVNRIRALRASRESLIATFGGDALNRVIFVLAGRKVRDNTSGFILCERATALELGFSGRHGEYCIRFIASALSRGLDVREVPYVIRLRTQGTSKTGANLLRLVRNGGRYLLASLGAITRGASPSNLVAMNHGRTGSKSLQHS